jgi:hypothetical protein
LGGQIEAVGKGVLRGGLGVKNKGEKGKRENGQKGKERREAKPFSSFPPNDNPPTPPQTPLPTPLKLWRNRGQGLDFFEISQGVGERIVNGPATPGPLSQDYLQQSHLEA